MKMLQWHGEETFLKNEIQFSTVITSVVCLIGFRNRQGRVDFVTSHTTNKYLSSHLYCLPYMPAIKVLKSLTDGIPFSRGEMSLVGGRGWHHWRNFHGWVGQVRQVGQGGGGGLAQRKKSPDLESMEVGISVIVAICIFALWKHVLYNATSLSLIFSWRYSLGCMHRKQFQIFSGKGTILLLHL